MKVYDAPELQAAYELGNRHKWSEVFAAIEHMAQEFRETPHVLETLRELNRRIALPPGVIVARRAALAAAAREALTWFVNRAEGCADPTCFVCGEKNRVASAGFDALDELESIGAR